MSGGLGSYISDATRKPYYLCIIKKCLLKYLTIRLRIIGSFLTTMCALQQRSRESERDPAFNVECCASPYASH